MQKRILVGLLALCLLTGGALAEVYAGTTAAGRTVPVAAESGGTLDEVHVQSGDVVAEGNALASLRTTKVFAAEDGTVARILAKEGAAINGAVLELSPVSRYTIHCTVDGAYQTASATRIRAGESLYIRCTINGTHRGTGIITRIDGAEYRVETTGGELYIGEIVYLYRDADFTYTQRVGIGTVVTADTLPYESQGTLIRLHVSEGEYVERGELLYEIAEGRETELTAPTGGIVTEAASPGDALRANQTVFAIAPFDEILVEIQVDETTAGQLSPGDPTELIYADDPEEASIPGTILSVSRVIENDLCTVRIAPEDPPARLGLTVYARIGE